MATTEGTNIYYPDNSTPFNINTILANMAQSVETNVGPYVENQDYQSLTGEAYISSSGSGKHLMIARTGKLVTLSWFVERTTGNFPVAREKVCDLPEDMWPPFNHWQIARGATNGSDLSQVHISPNGTFNVGSHTNLVNTSLGVITYRTA